MIRFLHIGIHRYQCNSQCESCPVRFRCYTEPVFHPLVMDFHEYVMCRDTCIECEKGWGTKTMLEGMTLNDIRDKGCAPTLESWGGL